MESRPISRLFVLSDAPSNRRRLLGRMHLSLVEIKSEQRLTRILDLVIT